VLVRSLTAEFDPDKYRDEYRVQVMDLIAKKANGEQFELPAVEAGAPKIVDLMAALEASVEAAKESRPRQPDRSQGSGRIGRQAARQASRQEGRAAQVGVASKPRPDRGGKRPQSLGSPSCARVLIVLDVITSQRGGWARPRRGPHRRCLGSCGRERRRVFLEKLQADSAPQLTSGQSSRALTAGVAGNSLRRSAVHPCSTGL
jgi:hypothetical protein